MTSNDIMKLYLNHRVVLKQIFSYSLLKREKKIFKTDNKFEESRIEQDRSNMLVKASM